MGGPQVEEIHLLGSPGSNSEGENGRGVRHLEFNICFCHSFGFMKVPTWSSVFSVWIKKNTKNLKKNIKDLYLHNFKISNDILTIINVDDNNFISDTWLIFVQLFLEYHFLNATKSCFEIVNNSLW